MQTYKKPILSIKNIVDHHYSHRGVKISVYRIQFICKKFAHWPKFQVKFENFKNQFFMVILMHTLVIHTGEYKLVCPHRYDFVKNAHQSKSEVRCLFACSNNQIFSSHLRFWLLCNVSKCYIHRDTLISTPLCEL